MNCDFFVEMFQKIWHKKMYDYWSIFYKKIQFQSFKHFSPNWVLLINCEICFYGNLFLLFYFFQFRLQIQFSIHV